MVEVKLFAVPVSGAARALLLPAPIPVPWVGTAGIQPSLVSWVRAAETLLTSATIKFPRVGLDGVQPVHAPMLAPWVREAETLLTPEPICPYTGSQGKGSQGPIRPCSCICSSGGVSCCPARDWLWPPPAASTSLLEGSGEPSQSLAPEMSLCQLVLPRTEELYLCWCYCTFGQPQDQFHCLCWMHGQPTDLLCHLCCCRPDLLHHHCWPRGWPPESSDGYTHTCQPSLFYFYYFFIFLGGES